MTTTSETLRPEFQAQIEQAFAVGVVDTFGSSEGLLGASAPGEEAITFASDGRVVELVDEHDRPVPPGQPSASVLVTNLYNLGQPLIRYRMEDRFVQQPQAREHGHLRATVDGQASDALRWGDLVVHPLTVVNELLHTPAVADYIVRQTPTGVDIDVVLSKETALDVLSERVSRDLAAAGLDAPQVAVRAVDDVGRRQGRPDRPPRPHLTLSVWIGVRQRASSLLARGDARSLPSATLAPAAVEFPAGAVADPASYVALAASCASQLPG